MDGPILLDSDDLHALGLYLIQELQEPNFWVDVIFMTLFLTEEEKLESKAWSLFFLEATFEFLKQISQDPNWASNHREVGPCMTRTSQDLRKSHRESFKFKVEDDDAEVLRKPNKAAKPPRP